MEQAPLPGEPLPSDLTSPTPPASSPHRLHHAFAWLATLLVPVALVLSAVRLLLFPAFLDFQYNTPGFPDDPYGFTKAERLHWSKIALEYLVNDAGIEFLGDLRFEDGTPVYNERELRHMVDVKVVLRAALDVWMISLAVLFLMAFWAWRGGWKRLYLDGVARGGWLTVILLGAAIGLVALSFGVFFVAFHNVFFEEGTWVFYYSDTLIRLFPERFWRDIFLYVGGFAVISGLALGLGLRKKG